MTATYSLRTHHGWGHTIELESDEVAMDAARRLAERHNVTVDVREGKWNEFDTGRVVGKAVAA